ncbi:acyl-phosphate glycerol-3-phosphate acyltransferase [Poseidonocella pacifica]|uniref:Glycerol-3-phosphate acyltransferase n=1 Tax=Poseidonocella pacifica TaxID=871651 RepID=A0A1I0XH82_9RHOB|nr:glycerol-3-phosphate 1-O-acyltransferase PlsY [Poseidonocella pacifica]SFB00047.1 acyl-phosphate glycerol-3-phosphate acyltransferase [Poseidonocella pacifica]
MPDLVTAPGVLVLWLVVGYLLGSIPFGMLITRAMNLGDLRKVGSGNIGATNVLRTGSKGAAAATLLLDGGKAALAVMLARAMAGPDAAQLAGLAAFLGHCFPVWLRFRGGKGVATFLGLWLALAWPVGLACCAIWLLSAVVFRISSLAALIASASSVIFIGLFGPGNGIALALVTIALLYWRHRENIARLISGTESRIGQK